MLGFHSLLPDTVPQNKVPASSISTSFSSIQACHRILQILLRHNDGGDATTSHEAVKPQVTYQSIDENLCSLFTLMEGVYVCQFLKQINHSYGHM